MASSGDGVNSRAAELPCDTPYRMSAVVEEDKSDRQTAVEAGCSRSSVTIKWREHGISGSPWQVKLPHDMRYEKHVREEKNASGLAEEIGATRRITEASPERYGIRGKRGDYDSTAIEDEFWRMHAEENLTSGDYQKDGIVKVQAGQDSPAHAKAR